jgi:hypothetical protein
LEFTGIGIAKTFTHLDLRPVPSVCFLYWPELSRNPWLLNLNGALARLSDKLNKAGELSDPRLDFRLKVVYITRVTVKEDFALRGNKPCSITWRWLERGFVLERLNGNQDLFKMRMP